MTKPPSSSEPPNATFDPLVEEAVSLLLHLHSGEETNQDWIDYQNWKRSSEAHRIAAEHAETIWHRIGTASVRRKPPPRLPIIIIGLVALSTLAFALGLFGEPRAYFADYRTAVGEQRAVTLQDGSHIEMDSGTSFDVGADGRSIVLYSGQIFVSVEARPRPFLVKAGGGTVQTLGTKFAVRYDGEGVTTFVTESAVRVSYTGHTRSVVDVRAGEVTSYSPRGGVLAAHAADIRALTAWQRGELVFRDRPLEEVIEGLRRYRRGKIVLIGEATRRLPVTGVFDIHDPDGALTSLSRVLPISVHGLPGLTIVYGRSTSAAAH